MNHEEILTTLRNEAKSFGIPKLADKIGVHKSTIYRALKEGADPTINILFKIAHGLGKTMTFEFKRSK